MLRSAERSSRAKAAPLFSPFGGEFRRRVSAESFGGEFREGAGAGESFGAVFFGAGCFRKMLRSHAAPPARVPPPLSPPRSSAAAQSECHLPLSSPRRGPARVPPPLSPLRSSAVAGPSTPLSPPRSGAAARAGKEKFADSKGFAIFAHNSLKSVYDYGKFERPEEGD